jgi:ABC-type branched-subunit amino acid transport system substrate-binding protein/DNA-binding SARP family transcriptional activator
VEFRILGPLEVIDQGTSLALGGPRQRLVLAFLVVEANRVVSTDRLIDRIWGDEPPDAARQALFSYVSRLRKLLGADRIQARPPGYTLVAERDEIDALRFADLLDEANRAPDREIAVARLTEALDLWRGGALSDLADYDALRAPITRLEELRLSALEDRTQAEIDLGRHRESIPVLEGLTREHPLRERFWTLLILALYRSGRQGDALAAYHRARTTLVEELGIDPSPELRRVHEQVLQQDPALNVQKGPPGPAAEADLPAAPTSGEVPKAAQRRTRPLVLVGTAAIGLIAVLAVFWMAQSRQTLPSRVWTIGVDLPLSGPDAYLGQPVRNAVALAVDDLNASGGLDGSTLALEVLDDVRDPEQGAANAAAFVSDPTTIAMVGPWGSAVAFGVIPITNEAGLFECSPAATHPGLTKPRYGALDLRSARPEAVSFFRLAPADDIQAMALASFAFHDLGARFALVIDDTGVGRVIADPFEDEFQALGGTTLRRALNPNADPRPLLAPLADELNPPDLVFFGGETDTGAVALRRAMAEAGRLSTPLLSWDFILDGNGSEPGSFIEQTGSEAAAGTYSAHASLPDPKASFIDAYREAFGTEPDEYAAAGYACVEIIIAAMRGIAPGGPSASEVRERLRAYVADPEHRFETVLGSVGFDANGDALRQFVTFYRVEASAADGTGDWVIFKKQDFGPAP